jgi:hypothetical protein
MISRCLREKCSKSSPSTGEAQEEKSRSRKAGDTVDRWNTLSHARNIGKQAFIAFRVHLKDSSVTGTVVVVVIRAETANAP